MSDFSERDWKVLRELKPVLLERLCGQILRRAADSATASEGKNHERFLKLWDMI
jgi:hypothetical protein